MLLLIPGKTIIPCPSYSALPVVVVGFTRIAVNFKFHSWFANFKLTLSLGCVGTTCGFVT